MKWLLILIAFSTQMAWAEEFLIWDKPRSEFAHNARFTPYFSVDISSQTATTKVVVTETTYVSPRNLPITKKRTFNVPLDGLYVSGNELLYNGILCGTVKTTTTPGPRSTRFFDRLFLTGNCDLSFYSSVVDGSRRAQVWFATK